MGDDWHSGFHYGEDEYDLPNSTNTYTDLQFFNINWVGTIDENGNTCCGFGNDGSFYIDKRNFHDPSTISIWNLSGSTFGFINDQDISIIWNSEAFDSLNTEYEVFLYVSDIGTNMRTNDSITINETELYADFDPQTGSVTTNMKILIGNL